MERLTIDEVIEDLRCDNEIDMYIRDIAPQVAEWLEQLKAYREAEEQGLLLKNPKDLENAILDRMKEFMDEYRSYSESSIDHFGGKADSMETAMKIVKGAFGQALAEMQKG